MTDERERWIEEQVDKHCPNGSDAYPGNIRRVARDAFFLADRQHEERVGALEALLESVHEAVAMSTNCEGCQIAYDAIVKFKAGPVREPKE